MYNIFEQSLTPYFTFNTILAKAAETAMNQHLSNVEEFTKIGLNNFYSGMNARSLEDMVAFSKKQPEIMQKASALLIRKSQGYVELNNQFYKSAQEAFATDTKKPKSSKKKAKKDYDLGESIVIGTSKKKSTSKAKKTAAPSKTKKATTKAKVATPKKKASTKAAPKTKKTTTAPSKQSNSKVTATATKPTATTTTKPVTKTSAKSPSTKATTTKTSTTVAPSKIAQKK